MKIYITLLLIIILSFEGYAQKKGSFSFPSPDIFNCAVRIECEKYVVHGSKVDTIKSVGSGFVFEFDKIPIDSMPGTYFTAPAIVTNRHVVEGCSKMLVGASSSTNMDD